MTDPRYCLNCRYRLDAIDENRCPECGRPFDPRDPSSWGPARDRVRPALRVILILAATYPSLCVASLHVSWLSAYMTLGRPPETTYREQPVFISHVSDLFFDVGMTGCFAFPLIVSLACVLLLLLAAHKQMNRTVLVHGNAPIWNGGSGAAGCLLLLAATWGAAIVVCFWDPLGAIAWAVASYMH